MSRIERTVVASGIIDGQYNHDWEIVMLYDRKYDSKSYNLYIDKEYVGDYPSVSKALVVLVDQFTE